MSHQHQPTKSGIESLLVALLPSFLELSNFSLTRRVTSRFEDDARDLVDRLVQPPMLALLPATPHLRLVVGASTNPWVRYN